VSLSEAEEKSEKTWFKARSICLRFPDIYTFVFNVRPPPSSVFYPFLTQFSLHFCSNSLGPNDTFFSSPSPSYSIHNQQITSQTVMGWSGATKFIAVPTTNAKCPPNRAILTAKTPSYPTSLWSILIVFPFMPRSSTWRFYFRFPHQSPAGIYLLPICTTCPTHSILHYFITLIIFSGKYRSWSFPLRKFDFLCYCKSVNSICNSWCRTSIHTDCSCLEPNQF
jgi:hypothetical protein